MIPIQVHLEAWLRGFPAVAAVMHTNWAWPAVESAHFIGLTLLFGSIAVWDLRLIGLMRDVPVAPFHRLVPFAIVGFAINAVTGFLFLVSFPEQYVYNTAFQLKLLCLMLAGLNVMVFYATSSRLLTAPGTTQPTLPGRIAGAVSIGLWMAVIVCGRMITFFRPTGRCTVAEVAGFLANCVVR